ncbi:hypothetical protein ASG90_06920 [Nocardioides sp. Soil797]|nr:hypothetical protein ASG90_06920 [Nocardioides sp. Soil797]
MKTATQSKTMVLGAGIVALMVFFVYLSLTASSGLPGQRHTYVTARFADVGGLRVGDDVREASVRVGQVHSIEFVDGHPEVRLQLDSDHEVYADAEAAIGARSPLGQNFVELSPGSRDAGHLDEDTISVSHTSNPGSLDKLLSTFDAKTRKATGSLLKQTGTGLSGHSQDLSDFARTSPDLLSDLGEVAGRLSTDDANLAGTLAEAQVLATRLQGSDQQLASLVDRLSTTMDAVAVDGAAPLASALDRAPETLRTARAALKEVRTPLDDVATTMVNLRSGSRSLGKSTTNLLGLLREARTPLSKVPAVAKDAEPAVESLDGVAVDASPLAQRLEKTWDSADEPATVLSPYAAEISRFFTYWNSANRFRDKSGHYLRIDLVVRPESVIGVTNLKDPLVHRNPYPAPEESNRDRASTLLGGE